MDAPQGNSNTQQLIEAQDNFEKRFSCPVCLDPKLKMVVAVCQHRVCSDCLYDEKKKLHEAMKKCPTCKRPYVFPNTRPNIPEDAIEIQRQLGVTECPMDGCSAGLWIWDVEKHIESCSYAVVSPKKPGSKRGRTPKRDTKSDSPSAKQPKQETAIAPDSGTPTEDVPPTRRITRSYYKREQGQQLRPFRFFPPFTEDSPAPMRYQQVEPPQCGQYFQQTYNPQWHMQQQGHFPNQLMFQHPQRQGYF